jgi:hypothetical protein
MCIHFDFKEEIREEFEKKFHKSGSIGKSFGELYNNKIDKDSMDILFIKFTKL